MQIADRRHTGMHAISRHQLIKDRAFTNIDAVGPTEKNVVPPNWCHYFQVRNL